MRWEDGGISGKQRNFAVVSLITCESDPSLRPVRAAFRPFRVVSALIAVVRVMALLVAGSAGLKVLELEGER